MKKIKMILALMLSILMLFSLCACGGNQQQTEAPAEAVTEAATETVAETEDEAPAEAVSETVANEETATEAPTEPAAADPAKFMSNLLGSMDIAKGIHLSYDVKTG